MKRKDGGSLQNADLFLGYKVSQNSLRVATRGGAVQNADYLHDTSEDRGQPRERCTFLVIITSIIQRAGKLARGFLRRGSLVSNLNV